MSERLWQVIAEFCGVVAFTAGAIPSHAQTNAVKEKPPVYAYVANWQIPRVHWAEMGQSIGADKPILDKALADRTSVGYGEDQNLVHQADGETHDDWWSAISMGGLLKVLDQFYASGNVSSPALGHGGASVSTAGIISCC